MARRVFADFDTELSLRLANRSDITSSIRGQLLNDSMFKIGMMYEHSQLQTTSTETLANAADNFALSGANLWWVEWMRNVTDGRPITLGDMDRIESVAKRSGPPSQYYTRGSTIFVDSNANGAKSIKVYYVAKPAQWSAGSAPYDEQFDILILMWAAKFGMETVRDFEAADAIGKQIGMTVAGMKLPVRKQQLNDYNSRLTVRR